MWGSRLTGSGEIMELVAMMQRECGKLEERQECRLRNMSLGQQWGKRVVNKPQWPRGSIR